MSGQNLDLLGFGDDRPEAPDDDTREDGAGRPPRRRLRRVLTVVGVLVLLVVLAVGGFVGYLGWRVSDNVTQADLLPTVPPPTVAADGTPITIGPDKGTNFLLVGSDSRGADRGRADVIVLVHVPKDPQTIQMVHFPRDLFVSIPGHGKNKINAAYAFGGEPLLVETIQDLVGIKIDHVARTDFEGFKDMTDAVGGVRVYAEEGNSATGNGGLAIQKGWNELNGEQALAFVRERYQLSEGDISRGRRQMAFVKALLLKATSAETVRNPLAIARFTDAATKNLVVDRGLSIGTMKDYALELRDIRGSDVVFATAPFTGFGTDPNAGSIDIVDEKGMALLGEALREDTMDDYLDVFVTP